MIFSWIEFYKEEEQSSKQDKTILLFGLLEMDTLSEQTTLTVTEFLRVVNYSVVIVKKVVNNEKSCWQQTEDDV